MNRWSKYIFEAIDSYVASPTQDLLNLRRMLYQLLFMFCTGLKKDYSMYDHAVQYAGFYVGKDNDGWMGWDGSEISYRHHAGFV
jgi:hypothetical protein